MDFKCQRKFLRTTKISERQKNRSADCQESN